MTEAEIEELFLDVMTEYLPSTVKKAIMKRVTREILRELQDQDVLRLDDGEETPETDTAADLLDRIVD